MSLTRQEFEKANQEGRASFLGEFVGYLKENRNWWLIPILVVLALVGVLVLLSSSGAAPFIYTLF